MGNSPGFPEPQSPYPGARRLSDKGATKCDNFDVRWQRFVESLDVSDEKIKLLEQLPHPRKLELVINYELNTVKFSPSHCVESIKLARITQITASKRKQDHDDFRNIFNSAEISLRTNKIEWVLEFLDNHGLEVIVAFMGESLKYLSRTDTFRSTQLCTETHRRKRSMPVDDYAPASLARNDPSSPAKSKFSRGPNDKPPPTPNFSLSRNKSASPTLKNQNLPLSTSLTLETLKDCLHLCLKCFKTLLNNQDGCAKAFENPEVIEIITFCILHPNYATKALALDLLSAICLIGGGHNRVLKAFDHFRRTIGENACFETVMNDFRVHEDLPTDQYNLEYSVACIQFINIVVHSPENINLRVYLQYAFTLLGLDDFLRALQARPGDKLNRHVEAYVANMVNCSLLLDDAEAKEVAMDEVARLETALEASENAAKQQAASFKQRDLALSELVESLRGKIRDINVAAGQQEAATKRVVELEQSLAAAHRQIQRLQEELATRPPAPLPRQPSGGAKRSPASNMTTSTTLPMGFEFAVEQTTKTPTTPTAAAAAVSSSETSGVDPRRKSVSLEVLSSKKTTEEEEEDSPSPPSSTSPLSSGAISESGSEVNYDTFSKTSGEEEMEKSRCGERNPVPCLMINQVSDMALARRTFAGVTSNLTLLASRLTAASSSSPCSPPSPSPAVPLPHWLGASPTASGRHGSCGGGGGGSQLCHQLAAVLPDPWAACFASAHRAFRLCEEEEEEDEGGKEGEKKQNGGDDVEGDSAEMKFLRWLVSANLVTPEALCLNPPSSTIPNASRNATAASEMDVVKEEEREAAVVLPLVTSLLSVSLNPFCASRLLSLLTLASSQEVEVYVLLPRLFDAAEAHLRLRMEEGVRRLSESEVYDLAEDGEPDWPLLQALLQVNLLPFAMMPNLQMLIEQISTLSACCNSIVVDTKLPTVLRIAEGLTSTLIGRPDFHALDLGDLSSLADWSLLMRRRSSEATGGTDNASSTDPRQGSEGTPTANATTTTATSASGATVFASTHRRKPFMEALYKAIELTAPEVLDWTHDIVHLESASRILLSELSTRLRELERWFATREALFPAPSVRGHLAHLPPSTAAHLSTLRSALADAAVLVGAAGHRLCARTSDKPSTFSDREFAADMASLARFCSAFKKWTSDAERRARGRHGDHRSAVNTAGAKASSCKVTSSTAAVHRNGDVPRRQRSSGSVSHATRRNGHGKQDGGCDRKRQNARHLNTVGIMDNILAGLDSEPLYADIHKAQTRANSQKPSDSSVSMSTSGVGNNLNNNASSESGSSGSNPVGACTAVDEF